MGLRAPTVVAADAHLTECGAHDRIVRLRQLIGMGSVFQLVRRPGQRAEEHAVALEEHAASLAVDDLGPAHAAVAAALLRDQIAGEAVRDLLFIYAQTRAVLPVGIALLRAEAVPDHAVEIGAEFEQHAELRHIA